jgi:iron complex transport system substrate-binding protein
MAMRRQFIFVFITALFSITSAFAQAANKPQRIVSVNLCLDALAIKLVEPERINALYYLSTNPQFAPFAEEAKHFYLHRGLAEDIVPRNPDLVIVGEYTSLELTSLLKQLHFPVQMMTLPRQLGDVAAHIRKFGELTASETKAEAMAQAFEKKLLQLDEVSKSLKPVPAFWYSSNGVVVGDGTLENELMTRAGFQNLALQKNIQGFKQIDLEDLLLAHPQVLIIEASDIQAFSLAQEYIHHPALQQLKIIRLPTTLSCVAPVATDAIENLIQQR